MNMLKRRAKVTAVAMCAVLAASVTPATAQTTEATTPTTVTTTQTAENSANGSLDQMTKVLQLSTTAVGGLIVPFVQKILGAFDRLGCALRGESPCDVGFARQQ